MKNLILSGLLGLFSCLMYAQEDIVLMKVGGIPVSLSEFMYAYQKQENSISMNDFINRFIRTKRMVCEACLEGLDTLSVFRKKQAECQIVLERWKNHSKSKTEWNNVENCTQGEWIAHLCVRIPQKNSRMQSAGVIAVLDSIRKEAKQSGGLEDWIVGNKDSLPLTWCAEVVFVKLEDLPKDIRTVLNYLPEDSISEPFFSYVGVHLLERVKKEAEVLSQSGYLMSQSDIYYIQQEYYDGILSGMLEDSLMRADDRNLMRYFKKNKKHYRWDLPHFKGVVLQANNQEKLSRLLKYLKKFSRDEWEQALEHFNKTEDSGWLNVDFGLFQIGKNIYVDKLCFKQGNFTPSKEYPYVCVLGKILKHKPESFLDVKEKVKRDYQTSVMQKAEEMWKKKFKVEINEEVLKTVNNHDAI